MGVYVYAMRKATIEVDGQRIGNYRFAYKPWGRGEEPKHFARAVNAKHAAATRAAEANEGVALFTCGDFMIDPNHRGVPVYRLKQPGAVVYDDAFDQYPVGVLVKNGKGWKYQSKEAGQ